MPHLKNVRQKTRFSTLLTDAQSRTRHQTLAPQHHLETPVFASSVHVKWSAPQRNSSPSREWLPPSSVTRRSPRRLGASENDKAVVPQNVGRRRGAEAGFVCFSCLCVSRLAYLGLRVVCGARVDSVINSKTSSRLASLQNTPCRTVAAVRRRLQASGIDQSRRSVHEYMAAEHWPAKPVICGKLCAFHHYIPTVKRWLRRLCSGG